jgi:hypothetical protein
MLYIKSGINMTEQPNEQNNQQPQIEKLLIDNPLNFQFHAAYLVYSETFDKVTEAEARKELNHNLEDLRSNKIGFETFYLNISHYRKLDPMQRQEKFIVATQRKKDWRMKTQRQERIKRHKK